MDMQDGRTPLHIAAERGDDDIVVILKNYKALTNAVDMVHLLQVLTIILPLRILVKHSR